MGQTEIDQLTRIFSIIGTPNSNEWPTETHIMRSNFSIMHRKDLSELMPNIPTVAKDLIHAHWTDDSIFENKRSIWSRDRTTRSHVASHVTNDNGVSLRNYLKSLRNALGAENENAGLCLFAVFLMNFHRDIIDKIALSLGILERPICIINQSHAGKGLDYSKLLFSLI